MSLNSMLGTMFRELANSDWNKNRIRDNQFKQLPHTGLLHSYEYLDSLVDECEEKEDYEAILDHLYQFDMELIPSYKELEWKIINKLR